MRPIFTPDVVVGAISQQVDLAQALVGSLKVGSRA
jgi:hypothetical protein